MSFFSFLRPWEEPRDRTNIGTKEQKEMAFEDILGVCCVAAFEQLATADERTNMVEW